MAERTLTDEEQAKIEALGGWDKLMETLKKRLEEQKGRHQGGNKWIGTGGTSPVRRLRLQPGRHPHRPGRVAQPPRGESLGPARVPEPRRHRRARHAQHQGRAAPAAQVRARGRARGARPRRHDRLHRAQRRLARSQDGARAAQRRQGAAVPRRRRLDGRPRARLRGAVLGGAQRVQAPRVFLLPQLRLRPRVEGQPPPPRRDDSDARGACAPTGTTTS